MAGDEPITFPDAPRAELDNALSQLVEQANRVLQTQGRLRTLMRANSAVVSHLELPTVLRTIVEAAVDLVGAHYGALGVIAETGGLEQFIHVGMPQADVERIGHLPEGHGLLGALIDDPRPIRIDSIADDPRSAGFPAHHPPMTAFLGVPITVRDTVYGNLYLTDPESGGFSEDDEQLVRSLAATAGFAIDNARLYAESSARQAWTASAAEMTASVLGGEAPDALGELIGRISALVGARAAFVVQLDPEEPAARVTTVADDDRALAEAAVEVDQVRSALEGAQPLRLDALRVATEVAGWPPGPALVAPFALADDRPAALVVVRPTGAPRFSAFELERATGLARQASLALELAAARADRQRALLLEERARIARDLHDHVIQQLFGAGLELQSVESMLGPGALADRVDGAVASIDQAIAEIRTAIFALSHQHNGADSLRHRVLDIVREVGGGLPAPATVSFSGPVDVVSEPGLADDIAAFVREGLTNVVRHAGATSASVSVAASGDEILVVIADDGHGIGDTTRRSGLGNLDERAKRRGGALTVDSGADGTRLGLSVPVPTTRGTI
ncbi:GAF domain-containing protein [Leifsonia virtsii]|uniref:GAF domain-containing protein n=1 Tax=Leifsonia virtsii TaxID=3035915 RepID=A0ABT8IWN7_9MICO|nr:GAF domain-containing protein [Leifsonia virtsii]MDN4596806.1 GAF domain-containing protein [Leifsonia virtsii]